jgi:hypothetical protein
MTVSAEKCVQSLRGKWASSKDDCAWPLDKPPQGKQLNRARVSWGCSNADKQDTRYLSSRDSAVGTPLALTGKWKRLSNGEMPVFYDTNATHGKDPSKKAKNIRLFGTDDT